MTTDLMALQVGAIAVLVVGHFVAIVRKLANR